MLRPVRSMALLVLLFSVLPVLSAGADDDEGTYRSRVGALSTQNQSVAQVQESNSFMQRSKSFYIQTSSDIKAQWAKALFEKDDAALERVRERLERWNTNNPEQRIVVKMPDV